MAGDAPSWAAFTTPAPGPAESIGSAANGCIQGAAQLPESGPGYRAVRLSRNRHWGHPLTVGFVRDLAAAAAKAGLATLYIGDIGQPRGGRLAYGHASHQTGLDVDVWLNLDAKPAHESAAARENIATPSLVLAGPPPRVDPRAFRAGHLALLRLAATRPGVDRVLVNPAIKQHLCEIVSGERGWLRLVRPWWGHDSHMHVHMRCPPGSPSCRDPPPIPPGDGCDATLAWWFSQPPVPPVRPSTPRPDLPAACVALGRLP
ncbi:MAG: penicillin-insensitive murein endopeptidase [Acetobacteraceae bacterium]|nr:penicillin-insensitive murein endopeptidase [Acetobacteraceae bacterium]